MLIITTFVTMIAGEGIAASYDNSIVTASEVKEIVSSDKNDHNYFRLYTDGSKLFLEGESTLGENDNNNFAEILSLNVKKAGTDTNVWLQYIKKLGKKGNYKYKLKSDAGCRYKYFNIEVNIGKIKMDGDYILLIMRKYGPGDGDKSVMYKNAVFRISGDKVSILEYTNVIKNNQERYAEKNNDPSLYMDTYMKDMEKYICRMPGVSEPIPITDEQVAFIKDKSDQVVQGAGTDYGKGWKIYEFTCEKLYYDNKGYKKEKYQYYHPYELLHKMDSRETTEFSEDGQVGTTCIGFASVAAALARAQGLPARIIRGHHINLSSTFDTWGTETDIYKRNHWWAEFCIDGQWIMLDPNAGSGNTWDAGEANAWKHKGLRSYAFYKPTEEQLATSYAIHNILGGPPIIKVGKPIIRVDRNDDTGKNVISWKPVKNAINYNVYVSSNKDSGYKKLVTTTRTTHTHKRAVVGKKYYYKVEANGPTNSQCSVPFYRFCDLPRPKNVKSIKIKSTARKTKISWSKVNYRKLKSYSLYVSTAPNGKYVEYAVTKKNYAIHTGRRGVKYYYKAVANCTEWASRSAMSEIVVN